MHPTFRVLLLAGLLASITGALASTLIGGAPASPAPPRQGRADDTGNVAPAFSPAG